MGDAELTSSDQDWLRRKLKVAEIGEDFDVSKMKKIVAGKKLWNYDNLEPTEKKGAIQCLRNKGLLGHNAIFTPEVIDDIHIKAQLGRYRMRGMALMKKIPTFDDLVFLPGTLTRFVIEGYREKCETKTVIGPRCENPIELDIPVYITGMSFGALSYEAKTALARGATMAGSATCSGEGGMI